MAQRTDGDDLDQVGDCRLMPVEDEIRLNELMCSVDVRSYMDCLPWATFGMCGSVSSLPMDGREVPPRGRRQRESEIHEQVRNPRNASFPQRRPTQKWPGSLLARRILGLNIETWEEATLVTLC